jgi:FtsZ-interacting cell division protein ZipA
MPELRLILFVAGALFLVALVIREWLKTRRAPSPGDAEVAQGSDAPWTADAPRAAEIVPRPRALPDLTDDLPVIEVGNEREIDVSFASTTPPRAPETAAAAEVSRVEDAPSAPALLIDWPDEAERRIVSLRVVPRNADRFSGRSVRQALVGAGFVHGPMSIFHQPSHDGRVVVSAASLTKPGTFALQSMDTERFSGVNLFSVLPGPLPGDEAFDRLVEAGRGIAARLNAELRDPRGTLLTTARVLEMRAEVSGAQQ